MNKSKQKGTRAETKVVRYLEDHGIKARRKALAGSKDEGDIEIYDAPRLREPLTIDSTQIKPFHGEFSALRRA